MGKKVFFANVLLIVLLLICLFSIRMYATHAVGADLSYRCLGGNQYEITLSFYRDCAGIAEPSSARVTISSASCGQSLSLTLTKVAGSGQEVTPICATMQSTCTGGAYPGVREWLYRGTVTLPASCSDWTISYDLCCRNNAITTINNPGGQDLYIYALLDNKNITCNSSPVFSNKPVPFACIGQNYCFNHGANDADGDSLVYSLVRPGTNPNAYVTYNAGYSAQNPVTSNPPVTFNQFTGDICMTPTQQEVTVLAVLVEEYRNGVKIGQVLRDIQLKIINCTNVLPTVNGINGTGIYTQNVCAGSNLCFDIFSQDPDNGQNVTMTWNDGILGAAFTTSGGPLPTGTFCWTPDKTHISSNPYCFTVMVEDDACPYNGSQIYAFCITVKGTDVDAGNDQSVNCGQSVTLTAAGTGVAPLTYLWSSGQTSASIQTSAPGTYIVTVTDANGCSARDTVQVFQNNAPVAAFQATDVCDGNTVNFTNQSTLSGGTISAYQWIFGDGTSSSSINPSHTYNTPGIYTVTLIATSAQGCTDTVTGMITVHALPIADFTATGACAGNMVTITDNSVIPSGSAPQWWWDLGNGSTSVLLQPSPNYTSPGTYPITLVVTTAAGCSDTVTKPVTIFSVPAASFTVQDVCLGLPVTFLNSSSQGSGTLTTFSWNFGDSSPISALSSPVHTYSSPGNYTVTLSVTDANGCSSAATQTVHIHPLPDAAFTAAPVCANTPVTFTNTSNGGISWEWNFGNGQTSTLQNPVQLFGAAGTFPVKLVVTNTWGCKDSVVSNVTTFPLPVADFQAPDVCEGIPTSFTDLSTLTGGTITSWNWDFGNGIASNLPNPLVLLPSAGTLAVSLTVTSPQGCAASVLKTVIVLNNPSADFSISNACEGETILFSDLSSGNGGSISSWNWNFGNTYSSQSSPSHTYTAGGTYPVTLTVSTAYGCADSITRMVTIYPAPSADFSAPDVCLHQATTFTNLSTGGVSWNWDFGNGTSSASNNPSVTFSTAGVFTVTLVTTSANGCKNAVKKEIRIDPLPNPDFTVYPVCLNSPSSFNDRSSITGGSIVSWNWNLGNNNTATSQHPHTLYTTAGTYQVTLTVTSDKGCLATRTLPVTVHPLPIAAFTAHPACAGTPVNFTDQSGSHIASRSWNFGDNSGSSAASPYHTYLVHGSYGVQLIVTDQNGCKDTAMQPLDIYPVPAPAFTADEVCLRDTTHFLNHTLSNDTVLNWQWNFGDGITSAEKNPRHDYPSPGNYYVLLTAITDKGCKSTVLDTVSVAPLPAISFTPVDHCLGTPVSFSPVSLIYNGQIAHWEWDFGDSTRSNNADPVHQFTAPGTYTITMAASSDKGCSSSVKRTVHVHALPVPAFIDSARGCQPLTVSFTDKSTVPNSVITGWTWNLGDGTFSTDKNPVHVYDQPGTYDVSLDVRSAFGCAASLTIPRLVTVYPKPDADFLASPVKTTVMDPQVNFKDRSVIPVSWSWNFGDGGTSITQHPIHFYKDTGTYEVTLIIANSFGCLDTVVKEVIVEPDFAFYIPNAFTPNGDGHNDIFRGYGIGIKKAELYIFNRWGGDQIFESKELEAGWDGIANKGKKIAQEEVYIYLYLVEDIFGRKHRYLGRVSLIR